MPDRWTQETEDALARLLATEADDVELPLHWLRGTARAVLDWAARRGLLVEPGSETRVEREHTLALLRASTRPCGGPDLRCTVAEHHRARTVHTGPWRPVEEADRG